MDALDKKLDSRVDKMLDAGLLQELHDFCDSYCPDADFQSLDTSKGIVQAIGFKDWIPYLKIRNSCTDLEPVKRECMESMMMYTRRYARRQIKWIRSQIVSRRSIITQLKTIEYNFMPDQFKCRVVDPTVSHFYSFLKEPVASCCDSSALPEIYRSRNCLEAMKKDEIRKHLCEICPGIHIYGDESVMKRHLSSRRHRRNLKIQSRKSRIMRNSKQSLTLSS